MRRARGRVFVRAPIPATPENVRFNFDLMIAASKLRAAGFADDDRAAAALAWNAAVKAREARRASERGRGAVAAREAGFERRRAQAVALLEECGWKVDAAAREAQLRGLRFSRSTLAVVKRERGRP